MSEYYVGDVGTEVTVETGEDLSSATVTVLKVKKPDDAISAEVTWSGTVYDTTKIRYIIANGDWDQSGRYLLQSYVELPTWQGRGDTVAFEIKKKFG